MDVSTAPQPRPDPNPLPIPSQPAYLLNPDSASKNPLAPLISSTALAPERRMKPLQYGLVMGLAAGGSVALTCAVIVSVVGVFTPGRKYLGLAAIVLSIAMAVYVGIRSWLKQKSPRPHSRGRCPDCGREVLSDDNHCSLCGRAVHEQPQATER
jgi:hypothetical protein